MCCNILVIIIFLNFQFNSIQFLCCTSAKKRHRISIFWNKTDANLTIFHSHATNMLIFVCFALPFHRLPVLRHQLATKSVPFRILMTHYVWYSYKIHLTDTRSMCELYNRITLSFVFRASVIYRRSGENWGTQSCFFLFSLLFWSWRYTFRVGNLSLFVGLTVNISSIIWIQLLLLPLSSMV